MRSATEFYGLGLIKTLNLLAEILAGAYDFAVNIVIVINIVAINKTFCIYKSVKNIIHAIILLTKRISILLMF